MKRVLVTLSILTSGLVLFLVVSVMILLDPYLSKTLVGRGSQLLGAQIGIKELKTSFGLKVIGIRVTGLGFNLTEPNLKVYIPVVELLLRDYRKGNRLLSLTVKEPKLDFRLDLDERGALGKNKKVNVSQQKIKSSKLPFGFAAFFKIENATVNVMQTENSKLHIRTLNFQAKGDLSESFDKQGNFKGLKSPIGFQMSSQNTVEFGAIKWETPLRLTGRVASKKDLLIGNKILLDVGNLGLEISGKSDLSKNKHNWRVSLNVPDLAKLKVPPTFLPFGQWNGKITGVTDVAMNGNSWQAQGFLNLAGLHGNIKYRSPDITAIGQMTLSSSIQFKVSPNIKEVKKLYFDSNFSELQIKYKDLISKPATIPMTAHVQGSFQEDEFKFEKLLAQFAQISLSGSGTMATKAGKMSSLGIKIPKTDLKGLEKFILPLSRAPVKGSLMLSGQVAGDLFDVNKMSMNVDPLSLSKISAFIEYKAKDGLSINGPVVLDAEGRFKTLGKDIKTARVLAAADLSKMSIKVPKMFYKKSGHVSRIKITAKQSGEKIILENSSIQMPFGDFQLSGEVSELDAPKFLVDVKTMPLNLAQISLMIPALKEYNLAGTASTDIRVGGKLDLKSEIIKSPMAVKGSIEVFLDKWNYKPSKDGQNKPQGKEGEPISYPSPEPLLPPWPVLVSSKVQLKFGIKKLFMKTAVIEGVAVKANYNKGWVIGNAKIEKVFSGNIDLKSFSIPLQRKLPVTKINTSFNHINVESVLSEFLPEYKTYIGGFATGRVKAQIPYPVQKEFLSKLMANGDLSLKKGKLKTLKIEEMVRNKLSKIPKLGSSSGKPAGDINADIDTDFVLNKTVVTMSKFHFITDRSDELLANGTMGLDMNVDLKGKFFLSDAPVKGSVKEGCSDKQGRLVLDVAIKGNLSSPQMGFAGKTVESLLQCAAKNEIKKLKTKEEEKLKSKVKKESKKELDKIKDKLKDKFKIKF